MKKEHFLKVMGTGTILLLVLNMVLFALQLINWMIFWGVIIVGAVLAFKVLPKMKQ
mgnify:CR=1 FL=1